MGGAAEVHRWLKDPEKKGTNGDLTAAELGRGGSGSLVEVRLGTGSRKMEQLIPGAPLLCDGTHGWAACAGREVVGWQ